MIVNIKKEDFPTDISLSVSLTHGVNVDDYSSCESSWPFLHKEMVQTLNDKGIDSLKIEEFKRTYAIPLENELFKDKDFPLNFEPSMDSLYPFATSMARHYLRYEEDSEVSESRTFFEVSNNSAIVSTLLITRTHSDDKFLEVFEGYDLSDLLPKIRLAISGISNPFSSEYSLDESLDLSEQYGQVSTSSVVQVLLSMIEVRMTEAFLSLLPGFQEKAERILTEERSRTEIEQVVTGGNSSLLYRQDRMDTITTQAIAGSRLGVDVVTNDEEVSLERLMASPNEEEMWEEYLNTTFAADEVASGEVSTPELVSTNSRSKNRKREEQHNG